MTTQMIIRVEPDLKDKASRLAKEKDMGAYIGSMWNEIGMGLSLNNISELDIDKAIKEVRNK